MVAVSRGSVEMRCQRHCSYASVHDGFARKTMPDGARYTENHGVPRPGVDRRATRAINHKRTEHRPHMGLDRIAEAHDKNDEFPLRGRLPENRRLRAHGRHCSTRVGPHQAKRSTTPSHCLSRAVVEKSGR